MLADERDHHALNQQFVAGMEVEVERILGAEVGTSVFKLQPEVLATACFYATDLHTNIIPNQPNQHSMDRLADIKGELMMIWGKQDPYTPVADRLMLYQKLTDANINFTWHEFNGLHAFMRDEDARYDAQLVSIGNQLALQMFSRVL